jgi:Ni,Fe-hydrogenase III large subunit
MDRNETIRIVFLEELERLEQEFLQLERNISFFEFQYRSFMNILFRIFEVMD